MKYLILMIMIYSIILCDNNQELPKPIDFKKGIDIGSVIPKNLNSELSLPIPDYEIEKIKAKAANYIPEAVSESDVIVFETTIGTFKGHFFESTPIVSYP